MTRGVNRIKLGKLTNEEWMEYTYGAEEDEDEEENKEREKEKEKEENEGREYTMNNIISMFNTCKTKEEYENISEIIDNFDLETIDINFNSKIFDMYYDCFKETLIKDPFDNLLNKGNGNEFENTVMMNFCKMIYDNSLTGIEINTMKEIKDRIKEILRYGSY